MDIYVNECKPQDMYKLMTGMIVPRPIAFVSTKSKEGVYNLAPFSFFNVVTSDPPIVMFSVGKRNGGKKDTVVNIEAHPEFTINVVTEDIAQAMHNCGAEFKPEVSEFEETGLTPVPAKVIDGVAVKESPIHMECKLEQILEIGNNDMVLGRLVHVYIEDRMYIEPYKINFEQLRPLGRLAGNWYSAKAEVFQLDRVADETKLIP